MQQFDSAVTFSIPFYSSNISAGFPSPADEYMEDPLDLNKYLIPRPACTFLFKMTGEAMRSVGIYNNSILLVDRSITPKNGRIVVVEYGGELIVRRFSKNRDSISLVSENKPSLSIIDNDEDTILVWGVVTTIIHQL